MIERPMSTTEAIQVVSFHQSMLQADSETLKEYFSDLLSESHGGGAIRYDQALTVILNSLKGEIQYEQRVSKAS